jgi:hypothetical protein
MNKDLIVIPAIEAQVDVSCKEFCLNTWEWWAEKNNADLIVLEDPITDVDHMKPTWQRWYIWDMLEESGMDYERVALVDCDTMIRWDCPNIFDVAGEGFGVCVDQDNIGWVYKSIRGYKKFFPDVDLTWLDYFNCGVIVMNKSHKSFCKKVIDFWDEHQETLNNLQITLKKGTDQTPVNYLAKQHLDVKFLSKTFNLTHLNRKEILDRGMFIDCGYVWHFNGFDKGMRHEIMMQTWGEIQKNYEN